MRRALISLRLALAALAAVGAPALSGPSLAADDASAGVRWTKPPLDAALAAARESGRLVLLDCWADWCLFCHQMDREVWSQPALARVLAVETIPVRAEVDASKRRGIEIKLRYQIEAMPVTLLLHPDDGRVLKRLEGYQTAETILAALDEARALAWPEREAKASGDDPETLLRLAGQLLRAGDLERAEGLAARVVARDAVCSEDRADDAALLLADIHERAGRRGQARAELARATERCPGSSGSREIWDRLVALARDAVAPEVEAQWLRRRTELFSSDVAPLMDLAAFHERRGEDGARVRILEQALELEPEDTRILAALARQRAEAGDPDGALELVERAIEIDPHDPELRELRLRLVLSQR